MVKTKIKDFCEIYTGKNNIKIIILDEADSLTQSAGNNARSTNGFAKYYCRCDGRYKIYFNL